MVYTKKEKKRETKKQYTKKYVRKTPFADAGSVVGTTAGTYLGGPLGGMVGQIGGRIAGSAIGSLFGSGEYVSNSHPVKVNSLVNPQSTPKVFQSSGSIEDDSILVTRTEYIKDITSSAVANTFSSEEFSINPGQKNTFPILSNLAKNFEEYKFLGLAFHFKSLSGDSVASVQSGMGYVAMATQYDSMDSNFINKSQVENYSGSQSGKPSIDQIHAIECKDHLLSRPLIVRPSTQPSNTDIRLYDLGVTTVVTSCPGTSVILGELWVSYQVRLYKPKSSENADQSSGLIVSRSNTSTASLSFGSVGLQIKGDLTNQVTVSSSSISLVNLNPTQTYMINICWKMDSDFGSISGSSPSVSVGTLKTLLTTTSTLNQRSSQITFDTTNELITVVYLATPNASGTLTLTSGSWTTTNSTVWCCDVLITPIDSSISA